MKALVLAAGYATRLYPLTRDNPKPLLDVGGRALLDRLLESVHAIPAIDGTIVVTNAKFAARFRAWAEARGDGVVVVDDGTTSEEDRLGAIGDIGFVLDQLSLDDDLLVVAGDNLFGADIAGFGSVAQELGAPVLGVRDVGDIGEMPKYNQAVTDEQGRLTFFEEKPAQATTTLMGVALYAYPRHVLPLIRLYLSEGNNPDQPGRLIEWLHTRVDVYTWRVPEPWYDIGSLESLRAADAELAGAG